MTRSALSAVALCVVAPWSVSVGPVPFSLCTLILYLLAYILPWQGCTAATFVYLLLGITGLPVFSGFGSGPGMLLGPTGGFLLGYIPSVFVCNMFIWQFPKKRIWHLFGMCLGTVVLYALGTLWYCIQSNVLFLPALSLCVIPFLPGDAVKICLAMWLGPLFRRRLQQVGLI